MLRRNEKKYLVFKRYCKRHLGQNFEYKFEICPFSIRFSSRKYSATDYVTIFRIYIITSTSVQKLLTAIAHSQMGLVLFRHLEHARLFRINVFLSTFSLILYYLTNIYAVSLLQLQRMRNSALIICKIPQPLTAGFHV